MIARTSIYRALVFVSVLLTGCDGDDDESDDERTPDILALDGDAAAGETVFASTCGSAACHGADGNTPAGEAPSLADEVPEESDRELVNVIVGGEGDMPAQSQLSDQAVADVLAYLRDTFG